MLDYGLALAAWLGSDTLAGATWTVPEGITKDSESVNADPMTVDGAVQPAGTVAIVVLSGGAAGTKYRCTCRFTTAGGRTDERSIDISVRER